MRCLTRQYVVFLFLLVSALCFVVAVVFQTGAGIHTENAENVGPTVSPMEPFLEDLHKGDKRTSNRAVETPASDRHNAVKIVVVDRVSQKPLPGTLVDRVNHPSRVPGASGNSFPIERPRELGQWVTDKNGAVEVPQSELADSSEVRLILADEFGGGTFVRTTPSVTPPSYVGRVEVSAFAELNVTVPRIRDFEIEGSVSILPFPDIPKEVVHGTPEYHSLLASRAYPEHYFKLLSKRGHIAKVVRTDGKVVAGTTSKFLVPYSVSFRQACMMGGDRGGIVGCPRGQACWRTADECCFDVWKSGAGCRSAAGTAALA